MTNMNLCLNSIEFFIYTALIWIGFFWLYKNFALDSFRQKMFSLRDQLFDDAANGLISFDHPAYGILRATMNGFIRFGHRLNFCEMLISFFFISQKDIDVIQEYSFDEKYEFFTEGLDKETKKKLDIYRNQMIFIVASHLLKTSALLIVLTVFVFVPMAIFNIVKKSITEIFQKTFNGPLRNVEATAMALGRVS